MNAHQATCVHRPVGLDGVRNAVGPSPIRLVDGPVSLPGSLPGRAASAIHSSRLPNTPSRLSKDWNTLTRLR